MWNPFIGATQAGVLAFAAVVVGGAGRALPRLARDGASRDGAGWVGAGWVGRAVYWRAEAVEVCPPLVPAAPSAIPATPSVATVARATIPMRLLMKLLLNMEEPSRRQALRLGSRTTGSSDVGVSSWKDTG